MAWPGFFTHVGPGVLSKFWCHIKKKKNPFAAQRSVRGRNNKTKWCEQKKCRERKKKLIRVHGEFVYTRRVGGVVLKEELDTESKYGLWRQQGGWLQRAGAFWHISGIFMRNDSGIDTIVSVIGHCLRTGWKVGVQSQPSVFGASTFFPFFSFLVNKAQFCQGNQGKKRSHV